MSRKEGLREKAEFHIWVERTSVLGYFLVVIVFLFVWFFCCLSFGFCQVHIDRSIWEEGISIETMSP